MCEFANVQMCECDHDGTEKGLKDFIQFVNYLIIF